MSEHSNIQNFLIATENNEVQLFPYPSLITLIKPQMSLKNKKHFTIWKISSFTSHQKNTDSEELR